MCGIVAAIGARSTQLVERALESIRHRGPDASGIWRGVVGGDEVALGHARLSILDLSEAANQPFRSSSSASVIVFNGEIYNHNSLRTELQAIGVRFETRSDTEVLLAGYDRFGPAFVSRLNGMFAFVIVDLRNRKIFAARDQFGIKPLYYTCQNVGRPIAFASEIRALRVLAATRFAVATTCLSEFLLNGFLYEPDTGFEGVEKIPPGHYLEMDLDGPGFSVSPYRPSVEQSAGGLSIEEAIREEMALEVEADVPVGLFFSGGIDSTVLAMCAPRKIESLFVDSGDDSERSDRSFARRIAARLDLSHKEFPLDAEPESEQSILRNFQSVAEGTEEPISDYTFVATSLLSLAARRAGFKVMLSGMGGDELFAGYPRYAAAGAWRFRRLLSAFGSLATPLLRWNGAWQKKVDRLESFLHGTSFIEAYTQLVGYFSFAEVRQLCGSGEGTDAFIGKLTTIAQGAEGHSPLRLAMHLDRFGFLAHNLTVTDRASMQHGLEVRVPLLGNHIAAAVRNAPDSALLRIMSGKQPLRRLATARLGEDLISRPKVGFNPPLDGKIRTLGAGFLQHQLTSGPLRDHFDLSPIVRWIGEHFSGARNHTYRLWQLCYLDLWLRSQHA